MTHPYAEWLRVIADGGHLECQNISNGTWRRLELDDDLAAWILRGRTPLIGIYRIAPKTRRIAEFDVPYGLTDAPAKGSPVWVVDMMSGVWFGAFSPLEHSHYLAYGLLHSTREAAELHVKALRSL